MCGVEGGPECRKSCGLCVDGEVAETNEPDTSEPEGKGNAVITGKLRLLIWVRGWEITEIATTLANHLLYICSWVNEIPRKIAFLSI